MNEHLKKFLRLLSTKKYDYNNYNLIVTYNTNDFIMSFYGGNTNCGSISGRIDYDLNIIIILVVGMKITKIDCKINDFTENNLNDIYKLMGLTNED